MSESAWRDFLNPDVTRSRLLAASVYIASFEFLRDRIVSRIRDFLVVPNSDSEQRYQEEVLSRDSSPVYASLDWLKENGAISESDLKTFDRVKDCRNELAHELLELVSTEGLPEELPERYDELVELFRKIEVWWVMEVEVPTDPQFDGQEIDPEEVLPGPVAGLKVLSDIALGGEDQSKFYYEQLFGHGPEGNA
jgi:hypothetical protein